MSPKEKILDTCMRVITEMQPETAALVIGRILDLERECTKLAQQNNEVHRRHLELEVHSQVAMSDRDNRRRRMDIAMVILDDTAVTDLDAIAAIIWPAEDVPQNFRRSSITLTEKEQSNRDYGPFGGGDVGCAAHNVTNCELCRSSAPIDQPTQVPNHVAHPMKCPNNPAFPHAHQWSGPASGVIKCIHCPVELRESV